MESVTIIVIIFALVILIIKRTSTFRRVNGYGRIFKQELKKQKKFVRLK